jgi:hypothetical protein
MAPGPGVRHNESMLLAAVVVGALTAYYFGLRPGAYAAVATFVLSVLAMFVPRLALPVNVVVAVGAVLVWRIGRSRPRPPDAVLAVRFVQGGVKRVWSLFAKRGDNDRDR